MAHTCQAMPAGGYTPMFERTRFSTLAAFDRVLVVQEGRIVEEGRAGELRRRGRLF